MVKNDHISSQRS